MSFIGMDGAENRIRQLTSQLQSKDAELASVRNELAKKTELLVEEVKAKQTLQYQIEQESRGQESSSKDLTSLKNEVTILRQNLTNKETALSSANETIKKLEKENQGLEYELQCAGSNSDQSSRRILEQKNKLEVEVKGLKVELQRRDGEESRLKAANAKLLAESSMAPPSRIPQLKRPPSAASNFFGAAPTPSPGPSKIPRLSVAASAASSTTSKGNRRRSTSLSDTNAREVELQGKISTLETQLAGTKVKLDKAENQIMAAQRTAKKQVEEIQGRLEDANDELEFYRSQSGGSSSGKGAPAGKAEMEQLKQSRDALKGTVAGLMQDLEVARAEIQALEEKAGNVEDLERQVAELSETAKISTSQPIMTAGVSQEEVNKLRTKIAALEADLTRAHASFSTTESKESEENDVGVLMEQRKEIKDLKKDLKLMQIMVKEAEKERDEIDDEMKDLQGKLAIAMKSGGKSKVDEAEVKGVREALDKAEKQVEEVEGEMQEVRAVLEQERTTHETAIAKVQERLIAALEQAQDELKGAETRLHILQAETVELPVLRQTIADLETSQTSHQVELNQRVQELALAREEVQAAESALKGAQEGLGELEQQNSELQARLADLMEVEVSLDQAKAEVEQLQGALSELEGVKTELVALEFGAKQERDQAREARDQSLLRIREIEAQLVVVVEEHRQAIEDAQCEKATTQALQTDLEDSKKRLANRVLEIEELSDKLQEAASDIARLESRNNELEDTLTNRSTETEAQHRQEEVFQLKEDVEVLKRELDIKAGELDGKSAELEASLSEIELLEGALGAARADVERSRAASSSTESSHAHLLHVKIEKLRIERDELRQTMSFAKHEHRFALSATEADKASAMEELQRARSDLVNRAMEAEKLGKEIGDHRSQLDSLTGDLDAVRGRLAEVSTEKNDATDRYAELSGHTEALRGQYSEVQVKLMKAERDLAAVAAERDVCLEKLERLDQAAMEGPVMSEQVKGAGGTEQPGMEGRVRKHSRKSSLQMFQDHQALEQMRKVEILEQRLKEEKERVKRREDSIEGLKRELKQEKMAAELAREDVQDAEEEMAERAEKERAGFNDKIARLEAQVQAEASGEVLRKAEAELEMARLGLKESEANVQRLMSELRDAKVEMGSMCERNAALEAELRSVDEAMKAARVEADKAAQELVKAQEDLRQTTERESAVHGELAMMPKRIDIAEKERDEVRIALDAALADISTKQDQVDSHTAKIGELESEISTIQTRLATVLDERDSLRSLAGSEERSTRQEMESLYEEVHELKSQLMRLEEKNQGMQVEMGEADEAHEAEVADLKTRVENAEKEVEAQRQLVRQKQDEMEAAVMALRGETTVIEQALMEMKIELVSARSALDAASTELAESKAEATKLRMEHMGSVDRVAELECGIADLTARLEQTSSESAGMIERIEGEKAELALRLEGVRTSEDTLREERTGLSVQLDAAQTKLSDLQIKLEVASSDVKAEKNASEALTLELQSLQAVLEEKEASVAEYKAESERLSKEIEEARDHLASTKSELGASQERFVQQQSQLQEATSRNIELQTEMSALSASPRSTVDLEVLAKLEQEVETLSAAIKSKDADIEEASERTDLALKEKNKAMAKIAKLERKVQKLEKDTAGRPAILVSTPTSTSTMASSSETAANTAANVRLMKPTERDMGTVMAPPPIPLSGDKVVSASSPLKTATTVTAAPPVSVTSRSTPFSISTSPNPSPAPSLSRAPLRSVNVFDKSQMPASFSSNQYPSSKTGGKRYREGSDMADEKLPADAIMQPPSGVAMKSHGRSVISGFTPQRSVNAFAPVGNDAKENNRPGSGLGGMGGMNGMQGPNAYAESTPRRNIFAVDP